MAQIKKDTSLRKAILQAALQGRLLENLPLKTSFDLPGKGPLCPQASAVFLVEERMRGRKESFMENK